MSEYDDDAGRLAEPCGNCGLPNYRCRCRGEDDGPDDEPTGSCAECGVDLFESDWADDDLCETCAWYGEHGA